MTVEDFERELSDLGQEIRDTATQGVLDVLSPIIEQMRRRAPVDTGRLISSIAAQLGPEYSIQFFMLYYGAFQNYGVSGTQDSFGVSVPAEVEPTPANGSNYAFTRRRFGLRRQEFFDIEQIREDIVAGLQQRIEELTQD